MTTETTQARRLRAGIIGCGRIGSGLDDPWFDRHVADESWRVRPCTHAGIYAEHPRIELVAGADLDPDRRQAFARRWGVSAVYADYRAMLENERLDIVSIATRGPDHCQPTVDAARSGVLGILLEKHMASSLQQADAMIAACAASGTRLVINYTMRFDPTVQQAAALVREGRIGDLKTMVCHFPGRLVHSGSHFFDLFRLFAGDVEVVLGRLEGDLAGDVNGSVYLEHQSGVRTFADGRPKIAGTYLELLGTEGLLRFRNDAASGWELLRPSRRSRRADAYYQPPLVRERLPALDPELDRLGSIRSGRNITRLAVEELLACIRERRESFSGGAEGRAALEIVAAAYESQAGGGSLVHLPLADRTRSIEAI